MYLPLYSLGFRQALEEVCGQRVSGEGEVSSGMEEHQLLAEAVHDEGTEA